METLKSIQVPTRAYFEFFGLKWHETQNLYKVLKYRADCERTTAVAHENFKTRTRPIFEEGKTISSHVQIFNAPLREVFEIDHDHRKQVVEKFSGKYGPCNLLWKWLQSNANKGQILLELERTTFKIYDGLVSRAKEERKDVNDNIGLLDLNQTLQGKYGGTRQNKDMPESSVARKRRKRLEAEEAKLKEKVRKSAASYQIALALEIRHRTHFLETMSAIWQQTKALEQERVAVVVDAYTKYLSILETSEPFSKSREEHLEKMRYNASQLMANLTMKFNEWTKKNTGIFNIELYTDNWGFYEMGVVTNDVPMDIPENLIVLEPTENNTKAKVDDTKSSKKEGDKACEEEERKRSEDKEERNISTDETTESQESERIESLETDSSDEVQLTDLSECDLQRSPTTRKDGPTQASPSRAMLGSSQQEIASQEECQGATGGFDAMAGHRPVINQLPGVLQPEEPQMDRFRNNRRLMGPNPTGHRPPTCPRATRGPANSSRVGLMSQCESTSDSSPMDKSPNNGAPRDESPSIRGPKERSSLPRDKSSKGEAMKDRSPRDRLPKDRSYKDESPRDSSLKDESHRDRSHKVRLPLDKSPKDLQKLPKDRSSPKEALGGGTQQPLLQSQINSAVLQEDLDLGLEVDILSEESGGARPKRRDCPIKPKLNNWTDPNWVDPDLEPLKQDTSDHNLLSQFMSSFSKEKKRKRNPSPEIKDSHEIPFDFGCDDVDEESTVICPASNGIRPTTGSRAPPPTPGPAQAADSDSSDGAPAIPRRRRHHAEAVRMNALDDYEAKADSEISFSQGQIVKVLRPANEDGMAYGYTRSNRLRKREYGFFPANMAVPIQETSTGPTITKKISGFFKRR